MTDMKQPNRTVVQGKQRMTPSEAFAETLVAQGVTDIFGIVGSAFMDALDIFPAAGIDPSGAHVYYEVMALMNQLSYAGNEAARQYIDGKIDVKGAAEMLMSWGLYSRARAEQRMRFVDQYRSYVINYNLGQDLVKAYVERLAGSGDEARRWQVFTGLLSSPRLPSDLAAQ